MLKARTDVNASLVFADDVQENPLLQAWGAAGRDFDAQLFAYDLEHPQTMKPRFAQRAQQAAAAQDTAARARAVADFVAGMTDRYAASEHQRLTGQRLLA